jgi:MFS family permease
MSKLRPFVLLQASAVSSTIAGSATFIATPWLSLQVTGSSLMSAVVIAASAIPGLLLTTFVGGLVDRFGRRKMAYWIEVLTALSTALVPIVAMTVGMSLPALIALVVLKAIFQPGGGSARKSLLPDAADHAGMSLDRANSINEALSSAGFAIGPALAASLIAAFDSYAAFWLAAAASLASAVFAFMIRVHEKQEPLEGDPESSHPIKYAMQGFVTLVKLPALLIVFAAFMILSVIYMPTEMVVLPRYYSGIGQPEQMGYLITAMSIFTVLGALLFEKAHQLVGYANLVRIASVVIGLCMVPMSMLPDYWVMLVLGAILGFVWGPMMPLLNTLIQTMVPANVRGRVFAIEQVMWNTAPLTSFIVTGIALDAYGVQPVYVALAVLVLTASIVLAFAPQLRRLSEQYDRTRA